MKVLAIVLVLVAVANGRHHHVKRDLKSDFLAASEKAVKAVHAQFFADSACTEEDALKLHEAHLKFKVNMLKERCEEGTFDQLQEEEVALPKASMKAMKKFFKKHFKEFLEQTGVQLSEGCNAEEVGKNLKKAFENRKAIKKVVEGIFESGDYPDLSKFVGAVKAGIDAAGAKVTAEYFPDTPCTKDDLRKIGHLLHHATRIRKPHRKPAKAQIEKFVEKFKQKTGVECSVQDIMAVGKAVMENKDAIEETFKSEIKAKLEAAGVKPPTCEDLESRELTYESLDDLEEEERGMDEGEFYYAVAQRHMANQARALISNAYQYYGN